MIITIFVETPIFFLVMSPFPVKSLLSTTATLSVRLWPDTTISVDAQLPVGGKPIAGGDPNSWKVYFEKHIYKWMRTGGTPIRKAISILIYVYL